MILNANIPLKKNTPARFFPWRVGVFLLIVCLGAYIGWKGSKILHHGITNPSVSYNSGIIIRLTPKNKLWLENETRGLSISQDCPFELTSILANYTNATWITVGETMENMNVGIVGKKNTDTISHAFPCESIENKDTVYAFPKPYSAWAFFGSKEGEVRLQEKNIQMIFSENFTDEKTYLWPKKENVNALPITQAATDDIPHMWQGLQDILRSPSAKIFFSWKTDEKKHYAVLIDGTISEESVINFFYDIGEEQTKKKTIERIDGKRYEAEIRSKIFFQEEQDGVKKIKNEEGKIVGFIYAKDGYTIVSTEESEWITTKAYWRAEMRTEVPTYSHESNTLAHFGTKIFIKENIMTIFNEEL